MNDTAKELIAIILAFSFLIGVIITGCLISEAQQAEYRIEALEATEGCDPCQLMLLSKGI